MMQGIFEMTAKYDNVAFWFLVYVFLSIAGVAGYIALLGRLADWLRKQKMQKRRTER